MTNDIPLWAKQRACDLANAEPCHGDVPYTTSNVSWWHPFPAALARYIAAHEQEPDPLVAILKANHGFYAASLREPTFEQRAEHFRTALSAAGYQITPIGEGE